MRGSPASSPAPGATRSSGRWRRTRRCVSPPSSTTSGWPSGTPHRRSTRTPASPTPSPRCRLPVHLELWSAGPRRLLRQSRYAALLTSMHGTRLYGMRDLARSAPADAELIRGYLATQRRWQEELTASLGADADEIARNSQLVWTWDYMSLAVCLGWPPCAIADVPTASDPVTVSMRPGRGAESVVRRAVAVPRSGRRDGPLRGPAADRAGRLARGPDARARRRPVGDDRGRADAVKPATKGSLSGRNPGSLGLSGAIAPLSAQRPAWTRQAAIRSAARLAPPRSA